MCSEKSNKSELTISVYTSQSDSLSVNIQGFDIWGERGWNQAKTFNNLTLVLQVYSAASTKYGLYKHVEI